MALFNRIAALALAGALAACGVTVGDGATPRVVETCAKQHEPPPQANVPRLGLMPVYLTRSAGSDDAATRQWFADMDACTSKAAASAK